MVRPESLNFSISSQSWRRACGSRPVVEKEKIGVAHQCAGQRQSLLLAAGKVAHAGFGLLFELHQSDDFKSFRPLAEEAAKQADGLENGEFLGELGFLKLDAEALAESRGIGRPAQSQHFDFAGIGGGEPFADLDGGGLTGAIGTEQTEAFRRAHFQIEAVHGDDILVNFAKLVHAKGGLRGCWGHRNSMAQNRDSPLGRGDAEECQH
jgi:hypothetical protein